MKKYIGMCLVICLSLGFSSVLCADEQQAQATAEELSVELQNEGVLTQEEIAEIKEPMKDMINEGATKEEMKGVLTDLSNKGVKGEKLKDTVMSMNELVKKGESPEEAGNIVSNAAHQAQAEGLTGEDLAAKVHEAIQQRKMEKEQLKMKEKEKEMEMEQEQVKEKVKEKTMEMEGAGEKIEKESGMESGSKGSKGKGKR